MKRFLLLIVIFCFAGCGMRHVSEIHRVQAYGRNSDGQKKCVRNENKKFNELLNVIKANEISNYSAQQDFLKAFGKPIFQKKLVGREDYSEIWLYRYSEKMFGSEKVYLYFDGKGKLVTWERIPAETH